MALPDGRKAGTHAEARPRLRDHQVRPDSGAPPDGNLDQKVEALDKKIDRNQAQTIELLTQLVGQRPDAG
ncbi:hypothetical protein OG592_41930 (plasmid) [Streptomyces avidinii]|uniref:hypothetical protein n=1 Tax=Streptomyces avidinii TaxID=1895 RepID=UPI002F913E0B|nr:hypothetical protein OG592_41930 [Streptomyces avidinii]